MSVKMMALRGIAVILYIFCISFSQSLKLRLVVDSHHFEHQGNTYMMRIVPHSWYDAYHYCKTEGGVLFYPSSEDEATLLDVLAEILPGWKEIWVGAHDFFAPNIFVDLNGTDISEYYAPWARGEPDNVERTKDCVSMNHDGKIKHWTCLDRRPFVCKKCASNASNHDATSEEICGTSDMGYAPNSDLGSCYKVHSQPKTWSQAYATCNAEGSYLVIINNEREANFIADLSASVTSRHFDYNTLYTVVGFHDKFVEGEFVTIHGESLDQVYNRWAQGEPNNKFGDERCGSLGRVSEIKGLINDFNCDIEKTIFVCERDISKSNVSLTT